MGQNVKTYPTTQCKFLLILKIEVPVFTAAFLDDDSEFC